MNIDAKILNKILANRASLVAQWLRVCLTMQGTWVHAPVQEDPTCRGWPRGPWPLSLRVRSLCSATGEVAAVRGPRTAKKKKLLITHRTLSTVLVKKDKTVKKDSCCLHGAYILVISKVTHGNHLHLMSKSQAQYSFCSSTRHDIWTAVLSVGSQIFQMIMKTRRTFVRRVSRNGII